VVGKAAETGIPGAGVGVAPGRLGELVGPPGLALDETVGVTLGTGPGAATLPGVEGRVELPPPPPPLHAATIEPKAKPAAAVVRIR
jgi:hypothetical protein